MGFGSEAGPFDPSTWLRTGPSTWLRTGLAQDRCLLGALAVASVEEILGGGDAVVVGGVVAALCDVVEQVDEVASVVGARADLVGETLCRTG